MYLILMGNLMWRNSEHFMLWLEMLWGDLDLGMSSFSHNILAFILLGSPSSMAGNDIQKVKWQDLWYETMSLDIFKGCCFLRPQLPELRHQFDHWPLASRNVQKPVPNIFSRENVQSSDSPSSVCCSKERNGTALVLPKKLYKGFSVLPMERVKWGTCIAGY